jgi:hypothetical protein
MVAQVEYGWTYIAPNTSTSVFIPDNQAVAYSARVFGLSAPGVLNPKGHITLTQGGRTVMSTARRPGSSMSRTMPRLTQSTSTCLA